MAKRVKTTAAELEVKTGKLSSGMRRAERIVSKSSRNMSRELSKVESPVSRMGGGAVARGGRAGRLGGMMGGAGQMLKGAAVFGGVYGIQNEVKKAKQFEEVLVDIAVRGSKSKAWINDLRGSMMALSNEYGIGKDQLADYVGTIIDQTGNTELAVSTLKSMTAVAYSANVPMRELAGTIVEMQSKLALAPEQFETALGILAAQADKGKVPLKDMSKYLPEVLNATVQFGHTGVGALRDYGAMLQMSARGAGSLAEANTSMNRMLDQTAAKRAKIEKVLGIKLKKDGAWLQLAPMMKEIIAGLIKMKAQGKDVEKYIVATWGIRGKKAILPMLQQGMAGWGQRVGATGGKGGLTSFDALRAAGGAGTIQERVGRKRKLSPELDAWNKSVEKLKNKLHMHLLPAINKLGEIIPQISTALGWMIDNWKLLLGIWASTKMIRFFNTLIGGGGKIGGVISALIGGGGAAAGGSTAAAGGVAAAVTGGGGFIAALTGATAALGLFAVSIAPAVVAVKKIGEAHTPEGRKKTRNKILDMARREAEDNPSFYEMVENIKGRARQKRMDEGLALSLDWDADPSSKLVKEVQLRKRLGLSRSKTTGITAAFGEAGMSGQLAGERPAGVSQAMIAGLGKLSPDELELLGLSKQAIAGVEALTAFGPGFMKFLDQKFTDLGKAIVTQERKTAKEDREKWTININQTDPAKTAAAVTNARRGAM